MTILRSGTTKKYSDNWSTAFGTTAKKSKPKATDKKQSEPSKKTTKKPAKKSKKK